jgi:hypothetical protein
MLTANRLRFHAGFAPIGAIVLSIAASTAAFANNDDPFPGDIFALRPPHIRLSEPGESAADPRGGRSFPYNIAPPAIPPQDEVRLTDQDPLTLVYPSSGGSYSSGGSTKYDRLRIEGHQLQLDIFNIPIPFGGNAFVPQGEKALFVGQLPAGEYDVVIRKWSLPPEEPIWRMSRWPDFDPEAFEPPDDYLVYIPPAVPPSGIYATFSPPTDPGDLAVMVPSSFRFTVSAVPEPSVLRGLVAATLCLGMCWRIESRRRL